MVASHPDMDTLSFLAAVIDSLAWPVALLVALRLLREPLERLLPKLSRFEFRELQLEFDQGVKELRRAARAKLPADIDETRNVAVDRRLAELCRASPSRAVLEAWGEVERASRRLLDQRGIHVSAESPTRYRDIQDALAQEGLLDAETLDLYADLRQLRNRVAHAPGFEVAREQGFEYVDVALKVKAFLDELRRSSASPNPSAPTSSAPTQEPRP